MEDKAYSFEKAFDKTPVGAIEIKEIPSSRLLEFKTGGHYFDHKNALFGNLFRYIQSNGVSMTVPVEADIQEATMRFYIGKKDAGRDLPDTGPVRVLDLPQRLVVSIGGRGSYSEKNFIQAEKKLKEWLSDHKEYMPAAEPYAVFWNGPYIPGILKRFEVHVPVELAN